MSAPVTRNVTLIGIAGGTASGKTTVAQRIIEALPARPGGADPAGRVLPRPKRTHAGAAGGLNFDEPDALENDLLLEHLRALKPGRPSRARSTTSRPTPASRRCAASTPAR